jgi:energy-coupling factor transporter ATP-binding protein EcfA2
MTSTPIDDIEAWSRKLSPWRQDALRRLAINDELTEKDVGELLAMIKHGVGFRLDAPPPAAVPFASAHFGGGKHQPVVLKGVANVKNVNRLVTKASLSFCPKALTVVYGRNGSGKSGFVRILRTACRTRVENAAKLKVLADVYGGGGGVPSAEIVIDAGGVEKSVPWTAGMEAVPQLMPVAVFDGLSAQLYVDGGNQIRYLPFGLALPHRLNSISLKLRERLDLERATTVGDKLKQPVATFAVQRATKSQVFCSALTKDTTDAEIDNAVVFGTQEQARLTEVTNTLASGTTAVADLAPLVTWIEAIAIECETASTEFDDAGLERLTKISAAAVAARQAAQVAASDLFRDDPRPGIGSETWRALWSAARDYSVSEAYKEQSFPVTAVQGGTAECVLCQQPLLASGVDRMLRFKRFMDDTLGLAVTNTESAVFAASSRMAELSLLRATDFPERLDQLRKRDTELAHALNDFQSSAVERRNEACTRLTGGEIKPVAVLRSPHVELKSLAGKLKSEMAAFAKATDLRERDKLLAEKAELEDRSVLAANRAKLITRRDLLGSDAAYIKALAEVQTKGVTQRANELLDTHLTPSVVAQFNAERQLFGIMHLNVGLSRKSGQTKAEFEVDPKTSVTKITSEILSEGEQRALALAGFLTEVALTDGSGPIVVDDPVSSLDRDRSARVAERLAEEALQRQVIVFSHDIIFVNELCMAAEHRGIEPVTISLFGDHDAAGKTDASGMVWKGLNVAKRVGRIKDAMARVAKLHASSPSDYEYEVKNLYGRLRDTYERVVEEKIFHDIVRRGTDVIQTQKLRRVTLSNDRAVRFHEGMTRANTYSHDNPAAGTVPVPTPDDFSRDVAELEKLVADLKADSDAAEAERPQMKLKH